MWALLKLSQQPKLRQVHRTVALFKKQIYPGPMTQLRCTLVALLGLSLAACSSDDPTVVALNISYGDQLSGMETVHVMISQNGETFEDTFDAPKQAGTIQETLPDGGQVAVETMVPDPGYFKRYELEGFGDGEAELVVELRSESGAVLYTEETTFEILENRTVAAYATFENPPPPAASSGETSSEPPTSETPDAGGAATSDATSSEPAASSAPTSAPVDDAGADAATGDAGGADASAVDAG